MSSMIQCLKEIIVIDKKSEHTVKKVLNQQLIFKFKKKN